MRILLLTSVWRYKSSRKTITSVINDYVNAYESLGQEICVVHTRVKFPLMVFYKIGFLKAWLENLFSLVIDNNGNDENIITVDIWRYLPRRAPINAFVNLTVGQISSALNKRGFYPDLIISHWPNPNMLIADELCRHRFERAIKVSVFHDHRYIPKLDLKNTDILGYRNYRIKSALLEYGIQEEKTLSFKSPIDEIFLEEFQEITTANRKYDVIIVANLIKRKRVLELLNTSFLANKKICLIGEGPEEHKITELIRQKGLDVDKLPWISRRELREYYRNSKIFILLSLQEAYGLVYLEAMSQGCYPIGCKNEGLEMILDGSVLGLLVPRNISEFPVRLFEELLQSDIPIKDLKRKSSEYSKQQIAKEIINQILLKTKTNELHSLQS